MPLTVDDTHTPPPTNQPTTTSTRPCPFSKKNCLDHNPTDRHAQHNAHPTRQHRPSCNPPSVNTHPPPRHISARKLSLLAYTHSPPFRLLAHSSKERFVNNQMFSQQLNYSA